MKFSLWAWAAYWPAMGLMLLFGGMRDPVSLAVVVVSLGAFVLLVRGGALRATASRTIREFLIERPLYLVAAVILFLAAGAAFPAMANIGLALFSGIFLASLLLVAWRLVAHVQAEGVGVFRSRADQLFILLAITVPGALLVFIDAWSAGVGNPAPTVAAVNWLCLAYPPLLLLASKPFREPLQLRKVKKLEKPVAPLGSPQPLES